MFNLYDWNIDFSAYILIHDRFKCIYQYHYDKNIRFTKDWEEYLKLVADVQYSPQNEKNCTSM